MGIVKKVKTYVDALVKNETHPNHYNMRKISKFNTPVA